MTLLSVTGLKREFGGIKAVDGVDLAIETGEIRAIIGPNGAGKSTLVGLICGRLSPSAGNIRFDGRDITGMAPWRRVRLGIVYTFQITSVFRNLSCFDNVALAVQSSLARDAGWRAVDATRLEDMTHQALERVGLGPLALAKAATLAYGHQRLLEVAMGLALQPRLLIMDEPTQGLADSEIVEFCRLTRSIAQEATILLIEHNMHVVMERRDASRS
jgi:branched-chain amino acid transport system ATP-binding protein